LVPTSSISCALQKVTKNHCQVLYKLLVRLTDFDQTKRIGHHPWCGDDAYAPSLDVVTP
jgi:hypothetical protein